MEKNIIIAVVAIVIIGIAALFLLQGGGKEQTIGGDRDEHGCLGPAGYSWDEEIGACVRTWELTEERRSAAKIAVEEIGAEEGLTLIDVQPKLCGGCYEVFFETYGEPTSVSLSAWEVVEVGDDRPPVEGQDDCSLDPDPGTCKAYMPRYFFNEETGNCEEFIWGGCGGVVPFETMEECQTSCGGGITPPGLPGEGPDCYLEGAACCKPGGICAAAQLNCLMGTHPECFGCTEDCLPDCKCVSDSETCGIQECHGLDITCGPNVPQACTLIYMIGDICRQYASCETVDSQCTLVKDPRFDECKSCIEDCLESGDPLATLGCEDLCAPE